MLNITEIEFTEFQEDNMGNVDKYISNKEINEKIHMNNENKSNSQIFIMKDWQDKSNHFIATHTYDIGRGRFMTLGNLEKEMNRLK